jgi:hypothetical protein
VTLNLKNVNPMVRCLPLSGEEVPYASINLLFTRVSVRVVAEQFRSGHPKIHVSKNRSDVRATESDCCDCSNDNLHARELGYVSHLVNHGFNQGQRKPTSVLERIVPIHQRRWSTFPSIELTTFARTMNSLDLPFRAKAGLPMTFSVVPSGFTSGSKYNVWIVVEQLM